MNRLIAVSAAAALAVGSGVAVNGPASAAKTYKACVKKSTGEVRLMLGKKKKCKKGWKKTTWSKSAPKGSQGPAGPVGAGNSLGTLVDGNGQVVGAAMGSINVGSMVFSVLIDGGVYHYYSNGWLLSTSSVYFDNATCTGTAFVTVSETDIFNALRADPTARIVYRPTSPTLGPAVAYKQSGSVDSVVSGSRWYRDSADVCTAGTAFTGYRVFLTQVQAPPDRPGPLKVV